MKRSGIERVLDWLLFIALLDLVILLTAMVIALVVALFVPNAEAKAPPDPLPVVEDKLPGEDTPATENSELDIGEPLGKFTLTAYCPCVKCCSKDDGITATGTLAEEGRTIAVDPSVIPYGSTVTLYYEDGTVHSYIAEDCGGAIKKNRIDVFFRDHQAAREFGVQTAYVYVEVAA